MENTSKHTFSQGLETGIPSVEAARKAKRFLWKNELTKETNALEASVEGIYRPHKVDGTMGNCRRCAKRVLLGRWHDLYQCADNEEIEHAAFKRATNIVRIHLPSGNQEDSVFWFEASSQEI